MRRRDFFRKGAGYGAALPLYFGAVQTSSAEPLPSDVDLAREARDDRGENGNNSSSLITPNGSSLPWKMVDGVKVYHLIAEEVEHSFSDGIMAKCWGYNGQVHGPTIEGVEGDRVRIYVTNRLPAPTTVHWHGLFLPSGMDGVGGLNQAPIMPDETFKYEFTLKQHGTFMYHSHHDEMTQMALGLMGMIVIHPRRERRKPDRDFVMMLSEWKVDPGASRPDPNEMTDFNLLTINAKVFPGTDSLVVRKGDRVRIRIGNLSAMDHHPIHLHGHAFRVTGTDGGDVPQSAQYPETSVLVPVGATRTIEFIADAPGDWGFHCHMTHHVMNQMGHDLPNMIGVSQLESMGDLLPSYEAMGSDGMGEMGAHIEMGHMSSPENSIPMLGTKGPYGYITMGGMFTILKVREGISSYEDPGWYQSPEGTQASLADTEEMARDLEAMPDPAPTNVRKAKPKMEGHEHH